MSKLNVHDVYEDIDREVQRAHEKHGPNSMFFATPDRAMTILTEEVGEAAKEINEAHIHNIGVENTDLYMELIQVAAMAVTMAARIKNT